MSGSKGLRQGQKNQREWMKGRKKEEEESCQVNLTDTIVVKSEWRIRFWG